MSCLIYLVKQKKTRDSKLEHQGASPDFIGHMSRNGCSLFSFPFSNTHTHTHTHTSLPSFFALAVPLETDPYGSRHALSTIPGFQLGLITERHEQETGDERR